MFTMVSLRRSGSSKSGRSRSVLATLAVLAIGAASVNAQQGPSRETRPAATTFASSVAGSAASQAGQTGSSQEERRRLGTIKMLSGAGLALVGVILAANSGESVTIQDPFFGGTTKISARSNTKLYTGLGVAGFGGVLIYLGAKDRSAAAGPSPSLAFEIGPRTRVLFQKRW